MTTIAGSRTAAADSGVTQASIDRLLAAGADNYITKPLDLRHLLSAMHGLLEGPPSPAG